jgi:hypothetical protein
MMFSSDGENKICFSIRQQIASSQLSKASGISYKAVGGKVGEPRDEVEPNPESQASAEKIGFMRTVEPF